MKFSELEKGVAYKLGDDKSWNHGIGFVLDTERKYTKWGDKNGTLVAMVVNRRMGDVDEVAPGNLEEAQRYNVLPPKNNPPKGWRVEYVSLAQIKMTWDTWVPLGIQRREYRERAAIQRAARIADHTALKERITDRAERLGVEFAWKQPWGEPVDRPDVILTPDQFEAIMKRAELR